MDIGTTSYYYTTDNIKSVVLMTGPQTGGNAPVVANYTYNPYGATTNTSGTQATTNPYRYASGYTDPSGLIKYGARYYNPTLARFTQPDPSGQETNTYTYVSDNPTTGTDATGLCGKYEDECGPCNEGSGFCGSDGNPDYNSDECAAGQVGVIGGAGLAVTGAIDGAAGGSFLGPFGTILGGLVGIIVGGLAEDASC